MVVATIRHKGQITIPADLRKDLDLQEGDTIVFQRRGNELVIVKSEEVTDPAAGMLARYAVYHNPDPVKERAWAARSIAETDAVDE